MILEPQEYFTVVRQLHDWQDADTNYVLATIREARTDKLIATLKLANKGDRRFAKEWQVCADPSGLGLYITVATAVYTDAEYTQKNPNYGEELNTYLVDTRRKNTGGGGSDVDYSKIKKLIQENTEDLSKTVLPKLETFVFAVNDNAKSYVAVIEQALRNTVEQIAKSGGLEKQIEAITKLRDELLPLLRTVAGAQKSLGTEMGKLVSKESITFLEQSVTNQAALITEKLEEGFKEVGEQIEDVSSVIIEKLNTEEIIVDGVPEEDSPVELSPLQRKVKNLTE